MTVKANPTHYDETCRFPLPYHNRMPVILAERDYDMWISADTALIDTLALLRPYNGNDLAVHAVSKMANNVKNDMPECTAEAM